MVAGFGACVVVLDDGVVVGRQHVVRWDGDGVELGLPDAGPCRGYLEGGGGGGVQGRKNYYQVYARYRGKETR